MNDEKNPIILMKKPSGKKGTPIPKRSGLQIALPYISIFMAMIIQLCFIFVDIFQNDQPALILICNATRGIFGGAANFLPLVLLFTGTCWSMLHLRYRPGDTERFGSFCQAVKRTKLRTILCFVEIFILSVIFGIFFNINNDITEFYIDEVWEAATVDSIFISGGAFGGALAFLFGLFHNVISLILLILAFVFVFMVIIGLTPQHIYDKVEFRREFKRTAEDDFDPEEDERRMEKFRERELAKAKKHHQRVHIANQKREAKAYARAYNFEDEFQPAPPHQRTQGFNQEPHGGYNNQYNASHNVYNNAIPDDDDMIFVGSAPIDEDDIILAESKPYGNSHTSVGIDFGGDEVIDGAPSVENIFDNINDEPIKLSQISEDELDADMQGILPEKAEEVIQEEIALPYVFPPIDKLSLNKNAADPNMQAELQENAKILKDTLKSFNVQIREINYSRGPTVTRYELKPEVGTKVKSIANLVDDIALNLATSGVRIEAPIPNKPAVGIEVPNRHPEIVYLRDLIESPKFTESKSRVTACLGKDIGGNPICFDIAKMPHLLIAGATGMGKSVCINCIIISLLYKARPEEVKLILIDPKKVEFAMYKDIPHLYAPIVSDPKKAAGALASAVVEMERRFELIENAGVRNIDGYNETIADDPTQQKLPQIVIVIDELADLMMTAGKEVESCICRLAQKARAAGIHLIIGTQRPSVDVITGLIKANIPSRIACTVASQIDSRTILDMAGAEKLIGRGDMLFAPVGASKPMRVQGAFVSDSEVEDIVSFVKANNSSAKYDSSFISTMESSAKSIGAKKGDIVSEDTEDNSFSSGDSKFEEAVRIAIESGKISTSLLQRRLGIGYGRAAKLIDLMEDKGYVGAANGTKPREVLISMNEFLERKASGDIDDEE